MMKLFNALQVRPQVLWLLIMIVGIGIGCKKDKKVETDPLALLTSKKWYRSIDDQNPATSPKDGFIFEVVPECQRDDSYEFTSNGKYIETKGAVKCVPESVVQTNVGYSIDLKKKKLVISNNSYDLLELSETQLKLSLALAQPAHGANTILIVYKH